MNAEYNTQLCKSSIPSGIARSVEFHLILPSDAILTDCGKVSLTNI